MEKPFKELMKIIHGADWVTQERLRTWLKKYVKLVSHSVVIGSEAKSVHDLEKYKEHLERRAWAAMGTFIGENASFVEESDHFFGKETRYRAYIICESKEEKK